MTKTFAHAGLGPLASFALISGFLLLSPAGCGDSSGDDEADAADDMDTAATDTTSETGTTDTTDTTDTTNTTETNTTETDTTGTTAPDPSCPSEEPSLGDWLFFPIDGVFPDDVPTDVDESCTVISGVSGELALDCPFGALTLSFIFDPGPSLPAAGALAQLRLHHEPGWLLWPNIWITVDVEGGDLYGMQSSSVLYPVEGDYEVPGSPSVAGICGPFLAADPFLGEDPCGPQVGQELVFAVDGEEVAAWHASHVLTSVAGRDFEVWANTAREYQAVPETCDVAPLFYSLVTRRQR